MIDDDLRRLAAAPLDRSLDDLEADVWLRIQRQGPVAMRYWSAPLRIAAVFIALSGAAAYGGVAAAWAAGRSPPEMAAFSSAGSMLPSTLLEGGRT